MALRKSLLACLVLALACGGGDSDADDLIDRQVDAMNEMADILDGVTDPDSLEAAKPKMRALGEEMAALKDEWEAYVARAGSEEAAMESYLTSTPEEVAEAQARLSASFMKLAMNPDLRNHIPELTRELGNAFEAQ